MLNRSVSWLVHDLRHKMQIFPFPVFTDFVKKLLKMLRSNFFDEIEFFHHSSWMAMVKNHLKLQLLRFISLIPKKRKRIYNETLQKKSVHRATIYKWIKKFETNGNCDIKDGSWKATDLTDLCCKSKRTTKSCEAWNESYKLFVIQSCQKIE